MFMFANMTIRGGGGKSMWPRATMCPPKTAGIFATQNRGQQSRVHSNRGVYSIPGLLPAGLPGGIPGARLPAAALRGAPPGALPAWQVHAEREV